MRTYSEDDFFSKYWISTVNCVPSTGDTSCYFPAMDLLFEEREHWRMKQISFGGPISDRALTWSSWHLAWTQRSLHCLCGLEIKWVLRWCVLSFSIVIWWKNRSVAVRFKKKRRAESVLVCIPTKWDVILMWFQNYSQRKWTSWWTHTVEAALIALRFPLAVSISSVCAVQIFYLCPY